MRYHLVLIAFAGLAAAPAYAGGGMGDPSTVIREKNAICDAQRRGEGPRYPNMCLPELPVDAPPPRAQNWAR